MNQFDVRKYVEDFLGDTKYYVAHELGVTQFFVPAAKKKLDELVYSIWKLPGVVYRVTAKRVQVVYDNKATEVMFLEEKQLARLAKLFEELQHTQFKRESGCGMLRQAQRQQKRSRRYA